MEKIKEKIEKLLRLSLSDNPNEAKLAAQKAIELMEKYSLTHANLSKQHIITKTIELEYARLPGWIRVLYTNIASLNGCYMVYKDGYKTPDGKKIQKKVAITLVGSECDVQNIYYYAEVLLKNIEQKADRFKKSITTDRELVKSYRYGLVSGLYTLMKKASEEFNSSISDKSVVKVDDRAANAKEFYLKSNKVRTVKTKVSKNSFYELGIEEARGIELSRPIEGEGRGGYLIGLKTSTT